MTFVFGSGLCDSSVLVFLNFCGNFYLFALFWHDSYYLSVNVHGRIDS